MINGQRTPIEQITPVQITRVLIHEELSAMAKKTILYEIINSVESLLVVRRTRHSKKAEIPTRIRKITKGKISVILRGRRIFDVIIHERMAVI